jgi:tRNA-specific 2-thiouridylase
MKKVFVGMSGGVDSSLSAALLKEQGYDVTGVFIKVWQPDFIECTWKEDRRDAMRVASELDIPFVTLDLEKEYKEGVIDYMLKEYEEGRTPNPDVMCNREVKFGAFWRWAKEQGADYIATGHYAMTDNKRLLVSKDTNKDQTYFLWTLTEDDLEHVLFPIGHLEKSDVRKEAEKRGLYTYAKKDSQGLCFVGTIDVKEFLKKELGVRKGLVLSETGEALGEHDGAIFYTIGERHGFTITKKKGDIQAYYIISKNIEGNTLTVATTAPEVKEQSVVSFSKVSFVKKENNFPLSCLARARYRAELIPVRVEKLDSSYQVIVEGQGLSPVSGQSLVLYKDNECLGGGVIA